MKISLGLMWMHVSYYHINLLDVLFCFYLTIHKGFDPSGSNLTCKDFSENQDQEIRTMKKTILKIRPATKGHWTLWALHLVAENG